MSTPDSPRPKHAVWTIASKEVRLLARDPKAALILLAMPFIFIVVVGLSLGEGFVQKPDDRLRVTVVALDQGFIEPDSRIREGLAFITLPPAPISPALAIDVKSIGGAALAAQVRAKRF